MKRFVVKGIADVGAALFEVDQRYERIGYAEARLQKERLAC